MIGQLWLATQVGRWRRVVTLQRLAGDSAAGGRDARDHGRPTAWRAAGPFQVLSVCVHRWIDDLRVWCNAPIERVLRLYRVGAQGASFRVSAIASACWP
jgi:hypothetical protein